MRRLTSEGMLIGTPEYMSFDQAKGMAIDGRSDQYSLAIVLYEMLTGQPPFTGRNPLSIVDMHMSEAPTPPRRINPAVPPQIETVIMRALSRIATAATRRWVICPAPRLSWPGRHGRPCAITERRGASACSPGSSHHRSELAAERSQHRAGPPDDQRSTYLSPPCPHSAGRPHFHHRRFRLAQRHLCRRVACRFPHCVVAGCPDSPGPGSVSISG